jgi:uncharacterized membrane protein
MARRLFWLATAVFVAIASHAAFILFLPDFTLKPMIAHVSRGTGSNRFFLLDAAERQTMFPSYPPASVAGACAFDVSRGPVQLKAALTPGFWTLTIYSSAGDVIYVLNEIQSGTDTFAVNFNRAPGLLQMLLATQQDDPRNVSGWTVSSAEPRGLAVLWQPLADQAMQPEAERALAATQCGVTN